MSILPSWFRSTCLQVEDLGLLAADVDDLEELPDVRLLVLVGVGGDDVLALVVALAAVDGGGRRDVRPPAASTISACFGVLPHAASRPADRPAETPSDSQGLDMSMALR